MSGLARRAARRRGAVVTTCATGRVVAGALEASGEAVPERTVVARVGFLADLVRDMAARHVAAQWSPAGFALLASASASFAWKAVEDTTGLPAPAEGVHTSSRVRRMAAELAGRELRAAVARRAVVDELAAAADEQRPWKLPAGTDRTWARNLNRQVRDAEPKNRGFFALHPAAPVPGAVVLLAAADRQQASWLDPAPDRDGSAHLRLRCLLPTRVAPGKRDWAWHVLDVRADAARVRAAARLALPALRVVRGKVRADIALETAVPAPLHDGRPRKVLGLDWNVSTFLAGAIVARRRDGSLVRDGRPVFFQAPGWFTTDRRRREHGERLAAKAARIQRLTDKRPDARLSAKAERFLAEHAAVHLRRQQANRELARLAARWAVETALAAGCDTIAIEDLGSLEPHFKDAGLNARLSQRLRGQLAKALETACTMAGLRFVQIPPQYTSKTCHRCQGRVKFGKAPDRMTERGWRWALCPSCGLSMDRDVNAAINIATRALRAEDNLADGGELIAPDIGHVRHRPARQDPTTQPVPRTSARHNPSTRTGTTVRERRRAHRAVTPPRPSHRAAQRSAGRDASTIAALATAARHAADNPDAVTPAAVLPRPVDGLRYAHRHHLRCTPVPHRRRRPTTAQRKPSHHEKPPQPAAATQEDSR